MLSAPAAVLLDHGTRHWPIFQDLVTRQRLRGNDVPDAYLAALALEAGARFVTRDRGFARFVELERLDRLRWCRQRIHPFDRWVGGPGIRIVGSMGEIRSRQVRAQDLGALALLIDEARGELMRTAWHEAVRRDVGIRVTEVGSDIDICLDQAVPVGEIHYRRDWSGRLEHHLPNLQKQEQEATPPPPANPPARSGAALAAWGRKNFAPPTITATVRVLVA